MRLRRSAWRVAVCVLVALILTAATASAVPPKQLWREQASPTKTLGALVKEASSLQIAGTATPSAGGGYDAMGVNLLSQIPLQDFPGSPSGANDVWSYVSPSGREYAILGLRQGTGFVEVTNPTEPVVIANIPDTSSTWSDMAVYGEYCYNVNESGDGMQIINLTQIDSGIVTLDGALTTNGLETAHNIKVNAASATAYLCGANSPSFGLVAVDVSDPANPVMVGDWGDHYGHDVYIENYADCPTSTRSGPCEIAFVFGASSGMSIVDVTDKSDMVTLSNLGYPTLRISHQGWMTEDKKYMIQGDEGDESFFGIPTTTYVFDVQNLDAPFVHTSFTNNETSIDHNLMVRGQYMFAANYSTGLRIFDISDINSVSEAGYFDTYPSNDGVHFSGAWGINTQLPSGVVLIGDTVRGLFVLDASPTVGCMTDLHCNDQNGCTTDTCVSGACQHATMAEGAPCEDGDVCTFGEECDAFGTCLGSHYNDVACVNDAVCGPGTCDTDAGFCVCQPCGVADAVLEESVVTAKNRHLSFTPTNAGMQTAIRVLISQMPAPFSDLEGTAWWVGPPVERCENAGQSVVPPGGCGPFSGAPSPSYWVAPLQATPEFRDWSSPGLLHAYGPAVIPGGEYVVQHISIGCYSAGVPSYSIPVRIDSSKWGDVVHNCASLPCPAPEGIVTISDVVASLDKFKNQPSGPQKSRTDIEPRIVDHLVNISDVTEALSAFAGGEYPFAGP